MKYINKFIRLKCAIDLLKWKMFPNAKEICETYAIRNAVYKFFPELNYGQELDCYVIGDGVVPRTGAFFACTTACNVWSIDPNLRTEGVHPKVQRLTCIKDKLENTHMKGDTIIVVAPHAHADINYICEKWDFNVAYIVSMPCCKKDYQVLSNRIGFHFKDTNIPSPENNIFGWKIIKTQGEK